ASVLVVLLGCSATPTSAPSATAAPTAAPGALSGTTAGTTPPATSLVARQSTGCTSVGTAAPSVSTHVDQPLTSSGVERTYKWYVPAAVASKPRSLVVDLH